MDKRKTVDLVGKPGNVAVFEKDVPRYLAKGYKLAEVKAKKKTAKKKDK